MSVAGDENASATPQPSLSCELQCTLLPDRLCYEDAPGARAEVKYMPLDRVPVRAMPRGYKPAIGVALIAERCIWVSVGLYRSAGGGLTTLGLGMPQTRAASGVLCSQWTVEVVHNQCLCCDMANPSLSVLLTICMAASAAVHGLANQNA